MVSYQMLCINYFLLRQAKKSNDFAAGSESYCSRIICNCLHLNDLQQHCLTQNTFSQPRNSGVCTRCVSWLRTCVSRATMPSLNVQNALRIAELIPKYQYILNWSPGPADRPYTKYGQGSYTYYALTSTLRVYRLHWRTCMASVLRNVTLKGSAISYPFYSRTAERRMLVIILSFASTVHKM